MRSFFALLPLVPLAAANINFRWVQPTCDPSVSDDVSGCLRGQVCQQDGTCIAESLAVHRLAARAPRSDGRCGTGFDNAACDPAGPFGGCCSQYGYCGQTDLYCLAANNCQSGCTTVNTQASAPRADGRCGKDFNNAGCDANGAFGGCCSSYGYCGKSDLHCLPANGCQNGCTGASSSTKTSTTSTQATTSSTKATTSSTKTTSTAAPTNTSTAPRTDGRCGKDYGNAGCDANGAFGGCCSSYGYCGKTDLHCLPANGCQNGCTGASSSSKTTTASTNTDSATNTGSTTRSTPPSSTGEPVIGSPTSTNTPNPTPTGVQTTDGSCGADYNDTVCGTWPLGSCCSLYGFCGNTVSHCGDGCQSGNCTGPIRIRAPGPVPAPANANPGKLELAGSSGVPAMHAMLMQNGRVVFLDKVEDYTELKLPNGQYAYSSEWDPATKQAVALGYKTNAFCSGGIFLADGTMISVGGNGPLTDIDATVTNGFNGIRYLRRSSTDASLNGQAWIENANKLASDRWYPSLQTLPDGRIFCASGSLNGLDPTVKANNNPTYEILSRDGVSTGVNVDMDILVKNQPYYMYPFLHVLPDGTLYIFVARASERFDVNTDTILEAFDDLPGDYRTYPNTGSSIMFPLDPAKNYAVTVMVCGGGAYQDITAPTDASCGTHMPLGTAAQKKWTMESMPEGRVMVEGVNLPDGTSVWANGANRGAQGFEIATDPTYTVLLYDPSKAVGARFSTGPVSTIPRLYHSVALLLLDGTVLISGSNPVEQPILQPTTAQPFITEFRNEIYTPPYLSGANANKRPTGLTLSKITLTPGTTDTLTAKFTAPAGAKKVTVSLMYSGFVTHSVHMGQRHVYLENSGFQADQTAQQITVKAPPNHNITPPGPYVLFVLVDGVPAVGQWVSVA